MQFGRIWHGMAWHTYYRKRYNACFLKVMIGIFTLNKEEHLFFIMIKALLFTLESVLSFALKYQ